MIRRSVMRAAAVMPSIVASAWLTDTASAQASGARQTAFVGVNVLTMDTDRVLADQTVIVSDGVITRIGPAARVTVPAGVGIVDGRGKYVVPGLADLHVHLVGDRATQLALLKAFVANGVTTILNVRGTPDHLALRSEAASGAVLGPTIYTAGSYVNEPYVTTPEEVERAVVEQKRAGYDFVKMHGNLSREAYARLNAVGRRERIPIIGHSPRNLGFAAMFEQRQYAVVHAEEFIYDTTGSSRDVEQLDPRIPEIARGAAKAGLWVMPNLTAFRNIALQINDLDAMLARPEMALLPPAIRNGWGPSTNPYTRRFGKDRYLPIMTLYAFLERLTRGFRDAGVRLLVGTDALNTGTVPGTSAHDELALLVSAGLSPYEALRAATANAGEFLRRPDVGTVAVGMQANLLLLDANPLENIANTRRIAGVMVRGRWLPEAEIRGIVEELRRAP
ncbi:MAG: amidohydrolase family protein [Gemmatimonadota bacterium]|nr:amidohydrolase family protein [Gemmatimonadota bacterium]